jgi:hypothetical protein
LKKGRIKIEGARAEKMMAPPAFDIKFQQN